VLAFGPRASKLQERVQAGDLDKGLEVELVGYVHTRQEQRRDGTTREVREIYAAAIRRR
jgi:hypothetical protein